MPFSNLTLPLVTTNCKILFGVRETNIVGEKIFCFGDEFAEKFCFDDEFLSIFSAVKEGLVTGGHKLQICIINIVKNVFNFQPLLVKYQLLYIQYRNWALRVRARSQGGILFQFKSCRPIISD